MPRRASRSRSRPAPSCRAAMSPELAVLPSPAIEAEQLTIRIGGGTLLDAADFFVRRGELVLLCGPSGSGKTVLLKLIAGVVRPGAGALAAHGKLRFEQTDLLAQRPPAGR